MVATDSLLTPLYGKCFGPTTIAAGPCIEEMTTSLQVKALLNTASVRFGDGLHFRRRWGARPSPE